MYFWDQHKTITNYYELLSSGICDRYGLTQMEYDILMFLHNNPQFNTAAEIVKVRKSTKSHVSTSLKSLENNGLKGKLNLFARFNRMKKTMKRIYRIIDNITTLYVYINLIDFYALKPYD